MLFFSLLTAAVTLALQAPMVTADSTSTQPFTSNFAEPPPPLIENAFKASWRQHKWNANVSHVASGYIYVSPAAKKVRADETYDSAFGSSLFDYNKVNADGVYNVLWTLSPSLTSKPNFFQGYVQNPGFPILAQDVLVTSNAVFAGTVPANTVFLDPDVGDVTKWNFLFADTIPTMLLLDSNNVIQGYDIWAPQQRTYVITRFYNIAVGEFSSDVFAFPQPGKNGGS